MEVKAGQIFWVNDARKGKYLGRAVRDFDTDDDWYAVQTLEMVYGNSRDWPPGCEIPCRKGISMIGDFICPAWTNSTPSECGEFLWLHDGEIELVSVSFQRKKYMMQASAGGKVDVTRLHTSHWFGPLEAQ